MTLLLAPVIGEDHCFTSPRREARPDVVKVTGGVTYKGVGLGEFVLQKMSAYISQKDVHIGDMLMKETLDFATRHTDGGNCYERSRKQLANGLHDQSRHLWVWNLTVHVTQNDLIEYFLRFGDLEDMSYISGQNFTFVNFKKEDDAIVAIRGLQGFNLAS